MSYPLLPALLGASFVVVWVFIAGMVVRDSHREVRRQHDLNPHFPKARARMSKLSPPA
jgi:hypothetical protein